MLDSKYPRGDKIRLVLDNLKVHTSEITKKYLSTVPGRFEFRAILFAFSYLMNKIVFVTS